MEVTFKFTLDQQVKTPFGDLGVVSMLAVDDGGNQYYVKTATGGNWFKESQITAA
jgi:hypothetical protein